MLKLVLDTNVVLDWLVFDDPFMNPLRNAVLARRIVIATHQPAIDELQRVLAYNAFKLDLTRQHDLLSKYCVSASMADMPVAFSPQNLLLPPGFPRCRDLDDEHFLALAFHAKADALVSRDKAVLKLAKRAQKFGVRILDVPKMVEQLRCLTP